MADVTLRQLEYFIAVTDHGTVSKAAETLHLSQSAVSSALAELERAMGAQLLVRHRRGVTVTTVGQELLVRARGLVAQAQDLQNHARGRQESMTGPLRVGCLPSVAPAILPPVLSSFTAQHPNVDVSFNEASRQDLLAQLESGRIDLAILYDYGDVDVNNSNFQFIHLRSLTPYLLLPDTHRLSGRSQVSLRDIHEEPMVLYDLPPSGTYFTSLFEELSLSPNVRYRSANFELVRSLVAHGLGFSILTTKPSSGTSHDGHGLVTVELADTLPDLPICVALLQDARLTRPVTEFVTACLKTWSDTSPTA